MTNFARSLGVFVLSFSIGTASLAADVHGKMSRLDFEKEHYEWLEARQQKAASELKTDDPQVNRLDHATRGVDVEVYYGPWCEDSRKHLPVFLALLNAGKAKPKSINFYSLDRHMTYPGFKNSRKISRLPTFIFFRDGKELGRIVETPKDSVLADSLAILDRTESNHPQGN